MTKRHPETAMDMTTEQQAIELCREGRKEAFRPLVDAYFARCVRLARAFVGDMEDARDLVQDAFVVAYRALDDFELGRPFYPWLRGILLNRCRAHVRTRNRASRRRDRAAESPGHWVLGAPPGQSAAARRTADLVRRALAAVSEGDREILVLKHMEGYSYDELAEHFGIERGTVASRLYRARKRMRDALAELDPTLVEGEAGDETRRGDAPAAGEEAR